MVLFMFNRPETSLMFYLLDTFCNAFRFVDPTHTHEEYEKFYGANVKWRKNCQEKADPRMFVPRIFLKLDFMNLFFQPNCRAKQLPVHGYIELEIKTTNAD